MTDSLPPTRSPRPMPVNMRVMTGARPATRAGLPAPPVKRRPKCPPPPAWLDPAAAEIWRGFAKSLWRREDWQPEYLTSFASFCALQARFQSDPNLSASLVSQLRLYQVEFGLTIRSRRARTIERDGTT